MITSLTSSQKVQLELYAQKWVKIGFSTEPCNVERSKYWIRETYKIAKLKSPTKWAVFDSPLSCAGAQVKINYKTAVSIQVSHQVWNQVYTQVENHVLNQVAAQVWFQVGEQVRDQVCNQVREQVQEQVQEQVRVREQVREPVRQQVWEQIYGAHEAHWLSYYDYYLKVLKLDCVKPLVPLINLAKHCGWWAPYENVCFIQHRPTEIHLHDTVLHKDGGPAISYRDGFSVWALNGVRVPP